jgi:integrase
VPNNKYSEIKSKQYILSSSLVPFFGKMPVGNITTQHVEQYKAQQVRTGVSNKTVNNRLAVLSKCLVTAADWLQFEKAPPRIKMLKCPLVETDWLTPEEAGLLLSQARGTLFEMLLVTLRTGMRQGEVRGLQWDAINWGNRAVSVRHSWNDRIRVLEAPKSNRERVIPLDSEVLELLAQRKLRSGFVFVDASGNPFGRERLNAHLTALCKNVGLRRITWHILRHTFATHLMMRGVAVNTVQKLLGHASITTTMRYAHVPSSSLREAIDVLGRGYAVHEGFGQPVVNRHAGPSRSRIAFVQ